MQEEKETIKVQICSNSDLPINNSTKKLGVKTLNADNEILVRNPCQNLPNSIDISYAFKCFN